MAERPISVVVLYVLGDLLFALLAGFVLAVPLIVPAVVWWWRR